MASPREGTLEHNPGVGGRSSRSRSRKRRDGTYRLAFIGTLVEGVQVRHGSYGRKSHKSRPLQSRPRRAHPTLTGSSPSANPKSYLESKICGRPLTDKLASLQ